MALFMTEYGPYIVMGSAGILVESRVSGIILTLCGHSCLGKSCYSSNPGCQLEEILPEIYYRYWNNLIGLMDD